MTCLCLCKWVLALYTHRCIHIYECVSACVCFIFLLIEPVGSMLQIRVLCSVVFLLIFFFLLCISHQQIPGATWGQTAACQGKAEYQSDLWCCSVPDPERNPFSVGLAEDRGLPGLPGFANPWDGSSSYIMKPMKSKPRASFFSCNPLIFHSPWGNYCWGLRLQPEGWRK